MPMRVCGEVRPAEVGHEHHAHEACQHEGPVGAHHAVELVDADHRHAQRDDEEEQAAVDGDDKGQQREDHADDDARA